MRKINSKPYLEFSPDGTDEKIHYKACATGSLKEAKAFYENFKYIGSGKIIYADGVIDVCSKKTHFFI